MLAMIETAFKSIIPPTPATIKTPPRKSRRPWRTSCLKSMLKIVRRLIKFFGETWKFDKVMRRKFMKNFRNRRGTLPLRSSATMVWWKFWIWISSLHNERCGTTLNGGALAQWLLRVAEIGDRQHKVKNTKLLHCFEVLPMLIRFYSATVKEKMLMSRKNGVGAMA